MWNPVGRRFALLCFMLLNVLGCKGDITRVEIEVVPNRGCAPLEVTLVGKATIRPGIGSRFRWTIGTDVELQGPRVSHTFLTPGAYRISLTVQSETQSKTRTTTLDVARAALPRLPGLYVQQGCTYEAIEGVETKPLVKNLGKTSLEDLEQRIVGRKLSTRELLTHPLWRRDHTHTAYVIDRDQFVHIRRDRLQSLGFVSVGEDTGEIAMYRILPHAEPEQSPQKQVVMRLVDSWGLESVDPEPVVLTRTRMAPAVVHYVPDGELTAGLYVIEVKRPDDTTQGVRPVALVDSQS